MGARDNAGSFLSGVVLTAFIFTVLTDDSANRRAPPLAAEPKASSAAMESGRRPPFSAGGDGGSEGPVVGPAGRGLPTPLNCSTDDVSWLHATHPPVAPFLPPAVAKAMRSKQGRRNPVVGEWLVRTFWMQPFSQPWVAAPRPAEWKRAAADGQPPASSPVPTFSPRTAQILGAARVFAEVPEDTTATRSPPSVPRGQQQQQQQQQQQRKGCAVITAIFGRYEKRLKPIAPQVGVAGAERCAFIAFTDNASAVVVPPAAAEGDAPSGAYRPQWTVDSTPYHMPAVCRSAEECTRRRFLVAKFYKMRFATAIPLLQGVARVVWLDATVHPHSPGFLETMLNATAVATDGMTAFSHFRRSVLEEAGASISLSAYSQGVGKGYERLGAHYARYLSRGLCEPVWASCPGNDTAPAEPATTSAMNTAGSVLAHLVPTATEENGLMAVLRAAEGRFLVPTYHGAAAKIVDQPMQAERAAARPNVTELFRDLVRGMRRACCSVPCELHPVVVTCLVGFDVARASTRAVLDAWWEEAVANGDLQDQVSLAAVVQRGVGHGPMRVSRLETFGAVRGTFVYSTLHSKELHDGVILDASGKQLT